MKLNKEDMEFIKDLSNEMKTQDNRCTAQPYALTICVKETSLVPEGYGDDIEAYWNESEYTNIYELKDSINEYYDYNPDEESIEDNEETDDKINNLKTLNSYESFVELRDSYEADVFEINIQSVTTKDIIPKYGFNLFLTEKAYKEHLRINGHNLNEPSSWGVHLHRNEEMRRLYEIIHKIAEEG